MPKARASKVVKRELDEIWAYIARSNSIEVAERVLDEIVRTIRMLAEMPGMGTMREELMPGLRSFPVYNYLILYRKARGGIEVVHVVHGARDLERIFGKHRGN